jgi:Ca-activated chloride channel homolog
MTRRWAIRNLMIAGAASLLPRVPAMGPQDDPQDYVIRSEVRLVLLDVSVKDRDGGFVAGLSTDNFAVFEDGVRQPITVFANDDLPVTVGILVDESRSMTPKRADVLSAAETFIEASNPRDEVFVLNFNDTVKRGLPDQAPFSSDLGQLRSALYRGTPEGRTALYDALVDGLEQLEIGRRDKKTLVAISDGGDNASRHTRRDTLDRIERSIATIYTVGLLNTGDRDQDPGFLRRLATITGGEAYLPASPSGMVAVCRRIAKDIRTRYTIGYVPPTGNGADRLRYIRVGVSAAGRPRLMARTRTSYRYVKVENPNSR